MSSGQFSALKSAAAIIQDAGGTVVGRTRLQKIACILELTGLGDGFQFLYKHYGPYSDALATALRDAKVLGLLDETEKPTNWGGWFSIFESKPTPGRSVPPARAEITRIGTSADAIALELAATAAFLASRGVSDAWAETERRKPEKAMDEYLAKARSLYADLRKIETPIPLPNI